jgi:hypothetical protein
MLSARPAVWILYGARFGKIVEWKSCTWCLVVITVEATMAKISRAYARLKKTRVGRYLRRSGSSKQMSRVRFPENASQCEIKREIKAHIGLDPIFSF